MPKKKSNLKKSVLPKLWIYCEGTETEINYLNGYKRDQHSNNRRVDFVEIPKVKQNTPLSLVKRVLRDMALNNRHKSDIYWIVYDRESPAKYSDEQHAEALNIISDKVNVNIALTNVCVEFWLLLHFKYSAASYNSCDDLLANSKFKEFCKTIGIDNYDKAQHNIYSYFKKNNMVANARANALALAKLNDTSYQPGTPKHKMNPSTDFHLVLDEIDKFVG